MVNSRVAILVFVIILQNKFGFSQTPDFLLKQANAFLANHQYHRAKDIYRNLSGVIAVDTDFLIHRAHAEFESNQLDSAEQIVNRILRLGGNNTGDIYFLKGKIEMEKGNFENAAKIFKTALNTSFTDGRLRKIIIDDIKRCGVGESFTNVPEQVFLEQVGTDVNTIWDEINPIYSINTDSKFYFNSNRENPGATSNTGLDFELPFDMYSTSLSNGEWSEINALNPDLNTNTHDLLIDFNENGQVVFFKSGPKLNELIFKTDTLSQSNTVRTGKLEIPFIQPGDELFFFTDTFLLFSSKRPGGLGGYDLYYSSRRDSEWSVPKNLGDKINTGYDEISPFLAFDGRTLIFSSNNTRTMGGFDFFMTYFNDKTMSWSSPENLGKPINSAGDEKSMRLNKNRLSAIFSSNRKTGIGGYDIYFAYFKNAWIPQTERSNPITFSLVDTSRPIPATGPALKLNIGKDSIQIENLDLIYNSEDQLSQNLFTKHFDLMYQVLEKNTSLNIVIEVFTDEGNKNKREDHLQTMILAETIKQILVNKGIKSSRIWIKGMGSSFPRALEILNGKDNPVGRNLNRHLYFTFFSPDPEINKTIRSTVSGPEIKDIMKKDDFFHFRNTESGLNYKILAVSGANASNLEAYLNETDAFFIEKNNINGRYELMSKGYPDYETAFKARKKMKEKGFEDAVVIPYMANQRLQPSFISKWSEIYPDLIKYIYRSE